MDMNLDPIPQPVAPSLPDPVRPTLPDPEPTPDPRPVRRAPPPPATMAIKVPRPITSGRPAPDLGPFVDYDFHGIVRVRLLAPSREDEREVDARLGHFRLPEGERVPGVPDLTLRFVTRLKREDARWIEVGRTGFTADDFLLFTGPGDRVAAVPLDRLGSKPEFRVEHGARIGRLVDALVRATALAGGVAATHGSAFVVDGVGVLASGWARGGKTSALLSFAGRGADFVGDDSVFLHRNGGRMVGSPRTIPVSRRRRKELGSLAPRVSFGARARQRAAAIAGALTRGRGTPGNGLGHVARKIATRMEGRSRVPMAPADLFANAEHCSGTLDVVLLMLSHATDEVVVEVGDPRVVAERMARAAEEEMAWLLAAYNAFLYAFPHRVSPLLERASSLRRQILRTALADTSTWIVRHPYPVSLEALRQAILPYCVGSRPADPDSA